MDGMLKQVNVTYANNTKDLQNDLQLEVTCDTKQAIAYIEGYNQALKDINNILNKNNIKVNLELDLENIKEKLLSLIKININ